MQYSLNLLHTHTTQAFTHLEQGPDELIDDYLHHVSDPILKIYHTPDMSRISAEGTNHYVVVYGMSGRKLRDSVGGCKSAQ